MAITNSAAPTIHNRKSPRRQFIVQPILDPASHDLADSTHYDKDKATPTPPIIAMLPLEEEQDTNTNQEQANGVECCYFVVGDKFDQLLHDSTPLIGLSDVTLLARLPPQQPNLSRHRAWGFTHSCQD